MCRGSMRGRFLVATTSWPGCWSACKPPTMLSASLARTILRDLSRAQSNRQPFGPHKKSARNLLLPVRVGDCELPPFLAPLKYCDLFGVDEGVARARLIEFLTPAGKPANPTLFPGAATASAGRETKSIVLPGRLAGAESRAATISNIPINVPRCFIGREGELALLEMALEPSEHSGSAARIFCVSPLERTCTGSVEPGKLGSPNLRSSIW
jgi:hypothetical protein